MKRLINSSVRLYLKSRYNRLVHAIENPIITQRELLENLIYQAADTEYGSALGFDKIQRYKDFQRQVPIVEYNEIKEHIEQMMHGERDILWPGLVKWFSKSSGTTSDRSKFIPVTKESLKYCHVNGLWDALSVFYHNCPDARIFEYKNLVLCGSLDHFQGNRSTRYGDISAILFEHMPLVGRPFSVPDFKTAFIKDWEEKLERIAQVASQDHDITSIGGVPTWNIVLFNRILELTGADNLLDIWPNLQVYMHGGVNFEPYREQFKRFIPSDQLIYQEVYNASEGFFASQQHYSENDLLLFLDHGVFYEFIPMDIWPHREAVPLEEVELDREYCLVITTNGGLWRYMPGDTVRFTSLDPFRIEITGRTKHFINAFGEELMVADADLALSRTCKAHNVLVTDYTAGPVFYEDGVGTHEWLVEFSQSPQDLPAFANQLDKELQQINSDYAAKRYADLAMQPLLVRSVPEGTFKKWLRSRNKMGAQTKVPRLANDRTILDDILHNPVVQPPLVNYER